MSTGTSSHQPQQQIELPTGLVVRPLQGFGEVKQACQLYRHVFGYTGEDESLNPRLLVSLLNHSGSAVGAVDTDGTVLAFAYGWTAMDSTVDDPHTYHFSQAAVVSSTLQGQGIGRSLKRVQASVAHAHGAERMRWTFDPLLARNAHFNLDVLGARGRWYDPDAQGLADTDRITVEWRFLNEVPTTDDPLPPLSVGETLHTDTGALLALPTARPADQEVASSLRQQIRGLFTQNLEAVSCRRVSPDTAVYSFERTL